MGTKARVWSKENDWEWDCLEEWLDQGRSPLLLKESLSAGGMVEYVPGYGSVLSSGWNGSVSRRKRVC